MNTLQPGAAGERLAMGREDLVERVRICRPRGDIYVNALALRGQALRQDDIGHVGYRRGLFDASGGLIPDEFRYEFPNQCVCDLCDRVFLWRDRLKEYEVLTGAVEDPLSYDLLCASRHPGAGVLNVMKAGRSRVRCALC